jgi:hypothetical protein
VIVYRERVLPSLFNLALPLLLFPSIWAVMLPLDAPLAIPVAALLTTAFVALIFSSAPVVSVTVSELSARGATIQRALLGKASVIGKSDQFNELGPKLKANAWLSIQASVKGLVKVEVNDPSDPTPYWLISTRKPEELAKLLNG